jgi:hypothetical protein
MAKFGAAGGNSADTKKPVWCLSLDGCEKKSIVIRDKQKKFHVQKSR